MNRLIPIVAGLIVIIAAFCVGALVEYSTGFPVAQAIDAVASRAPVPAPITADNEALRNASPTRVDVPIVSRARGAEDAPRADTPQGVTVDLQRCYATMIARRLIPAEAKTVCAKLIGGITH